MSQPVSTYLKRKQAAFDSGLLAFKAGQALDTCPIRKHQGLARAWKEGWLAGSAEREKQSSGMFIARVPVARAAG
jgi:hypothetical protein